MTDYPASPEPAKFGAFDRFREVFALVFARPLPVFGISLATNLISYAIVLALGLTNPEAAAGAAQQSPLTFIVFGVLVPSLLAFFAYGVLTLTLNDIREGRPLSLADNARLCLARYLTLVGVLLLVSLVLAIGMVLLFVPGLWLMGVLAVAVPAVMLEGAGFGALRRSAELTRDYRWPIIGLTLLVILVVVAISGLELLLATTLSYILFFVLAMIKGTITSVLTAAIGVVVYGRLIELKEGTGGDDLGKVFA